MKHVIAGLALAAVLAAPLSARADDANELPSIGATQARSSPLFFRPNTGALTPSQLDAAYRLEVQRIFEPVTWGP